MDDNTRRAHDIAAQIATMELLRTVIGEAFFSPDHDEFRSRLQRFEDLTVTRLGQQKLFEQANDVTETFIKETACAWISKCVTGIRHPQD